MDDREPRPLRYRDKGAVADDTAHAEQRFSARQTETFFNGCIWFALLGLLALIGIVWFLLRLIPVGFP